MFYSHQLLARKASLGQIWMAATMHAKMNRKKLNKINLIKICEEILNPSVPMALRLSGILMGGVVIVYEKKVKLLYDDVNRLVAEINEAWKVKATSDPTLLPKGKTQAKKEAVTLPEPQEMDIEDIEQSFNLSNTPTRMRFQRTAYVAMTLDDLDETYFHNASREENQFQDLHQADAENITLFERFDSYFTNVDTHNQFERFDIEEGDETQQNLSGEHMQMPTTLIPSPPHQDEPLPAAEIHDPHPENQVKQISAEGKDAGQEQQRQVPKKRKARPAAVLAMDYEQTIIPGHQYQSWLQDASDIVSRRGRKRRMSTGLLSALKIVNLMALPPIVLADDLFKRDGQICYSAPLLKLWVRNTQPPHDSPSARTSMPQPPQPSLSSPTQREQYNEPSGFLFEDAPGGFVSESFSVSLERMRQGSNNMEPLVDIVNNGIRPNEADPMVTPRDSGGNKKTSPNLGLEQEIHVSEFISRPFNQKRTYSSSTRNSSGGLEPVAEESSWPMPSPDFKLSRLCENDPTPDQELLAETGTTQTQCPMMDPAIDKITESIRDHLKTHFDTPGAPKLESLNNLAAGLNCKAAAQLFYQTCVLATRDCIRVIQNEPYGDILISRGAKM